MDISRISRVGTGTDWSDVPCELDLLPCFLLATPYLLKPHLSKKTQFAAILPCM